MFGDRLELLFAVEDELLQGLPLPLCQLGERDDAALFFNRRNAKRQSLQHCPANAELAASFGSQRQLALAGRLVDLPVPLFPRINVSCVLIVLSFRTFALLLLYNTTDCSGIL